VPDRRSRHHCPQRGPPGVRSGRAPDHLRCSHRSSRRWFRAASARARGRQSAPGHAVQTEGSAIVRCSCVDRPRSPSHLVPVVRRAPLGAAVQSDLALGDEIVESPSGPPSSSRKACAPAVSAVSPATGRAGTRPPPGSPAGRRRISEDPVPRASTRPTVRGSRLRAALEIGDHRWCCRSASDELRQRHVQSWTRRSVSTASRSSSARSRAVRRVPSVVGRAPRRVDRERAVSRSATTGVVPDSVVQPVTGGSVAGAVVRRPLASGQVPRAHASNHGAGRPRQPPPTSSPEHLPRRAAAMAWSVPGCGARPRGQPGNTARSAATTAPPAARR